MERGNYRFQLRLRTGSSAAELSLGSRSEARSGIQEFLDAKWGWVTLSNTDGAVGKRHSMRIGSAWLLASRHACLPVSQRWSLSA